MLDWLGNLIGTVYGWVVNLPGWLDRVLLGWGLKPEDVTGFWHLVVTVVGVVVFYVFLSLTVMFLVWLERKLCGRWQSRLGPMYVGYYHGILQTVADTVKLMRKEDIRHKGADAFLFILAPILAEGTSFTVYACIPFAPKLVVSDLNVGVFFVSAATTFVALSILIGGWGQNSKYAVLGGMRSAAQLISYEMPLMLSLVVGVMLAGSMSMVQLSQHQAANILHWHIFTLPGLIAFILFFFAGTAEANRAPFNLLEAESELVTGFTTEYSGMKFSMMMFAEYVELFTMAALATIVFLGGWNSPFGPTTSIISGLFWFFLKVYSLIYVSLWWTWTLPRIRVDQLMGIAWKVLIPLSLLNIFLAAFWLLKGLA